MAELVNPLKKWRLSHPNSFAGNCGAVEAVSFVVLGSIGWLDYITGYELGFFIFYFIPVAISSWYCGRRLGLQVAFGSAIVWYLSDKYTHHPYSHSYFIYWEMFMRLLSFLTTTITISRIRDMVLNEERMLSELLEVRQELERVKSEYTLQTDTGYGEAAVGTGSLDDPVCLDDVPVACDQNI